MNITTKLTSAINHANETGKLFDAPAGTPQELRAAHIRISIAVLEARYEEVRSYRDGIADSEYAVMLSNEITRRRAELIQ